MPFCVEFLYRSKGQIGRDIINNCNYFAKSPLILTHATFPKELTNAGRTGIKQPIEHVTIISMEETDYVVHWDRKSSQLKFITGYLNSELRG